MAGNSCYKLIGFIHYLVMTTILAVSTDSTLLQFLKEELTKQAYSVNTIEQPDDLFQKISKKAPFILIIDFFLHNDNAAALCHQLKSDPSTRDIHIIILSEDERIEPFNEKFGSFSIIKKPVNIDELLQNIKEASHEDIKPL